MFLQTLFFLELSGFASLLSFATLRQQKVSVGLNFNNDVAVLLVAYKN